MRTAAAILCLVAAAALVLLALEWDAPYWTNVRPWALAFLIIAPISIVVAAIAATGRGRTGPARVRLIAAGAIALGAFALLTTLGAQLRVFSTRHRVLAADPAALERLGRHFIVGYRDADELRTLIERRAIAGVYISAQNVQGLSAEAVKQQIAGMQDMRRVQHLPPLWIATDQEGGMVSRLSPPLPRPPSLAEVAAAHVGRTARIDAVRQFALQQGRELAELGVNLNFAPVVDVDHGIVNPADRYTQVHQRAISSDPAIVTDVAGAYCAGLAAAGVRCTLKHFPGLGRVFDDTHAGTAELTAQPSELEQSDWIPFRALIGNANAFTMLAHARLTALDRAQPASASAAVIAGILRGAWRDDGVLITDDFSMGAIYRSSGGVAGSSIAALNAGVDLILISFDPAQYYVAMRALLEADAGGQLRSDLLRQSERRLAAAAAEPPEAAARPTGAH